jgi:hypothetical protein
MIRNSVFAAIAGTVLFAAIPAQSAVIYGGTPIVAENGYHHDVSHWVRKCKIVRVQTAYGWKNVRTCRKVFLKHKPSYGY